MTSKFWLRWGCVIFICVIYYVLMFYFNVVFAVNFSETVSSGGGFHSFSMCLVCEAITV